ncbi:MAG: adenosine-specific kinase [Candidatus Thermoplasmatota archaeon]|nr:adenosine-specific kinase [Candidatus Thermoplasmatota archaeon]
MDDFTLSLVDIEKPKDLNFILGQSHFIKSVEDLYEAMVNSVPDVEFGIGFCEASGARKVRSIGNNDELQKIAEKNALNIGAGHSFIIFLKNCFPLHVLHNIKKVPEICSIFCATANPTKVMIAETKNGRETGRGILGVIDGHVPVGVENKEDITWRKEFLRKIGYKK